jgi:hypothetical protein
VTHILLGGAPVSHGRSASSALLSEERAALTRWLGQRMCERGVLSTAGRLDERAQEMEQQATLLRQFVLNNHFDNRRSEDSKQS